MKNTRKRLQELYGPRPEHPLKKQRAAYSIQKRNAKQRGIEWRFTFQEWWAWWQTEDCWANRGMGRDKFVMGRFGDAGPYSPSNVYCATHAQNAMDTPKEKLSAGNKRGWAKNPATRNAVGFANTNSRQIETPDGIFANATFAAEHYGITRQGARYRAKAGKGGWRYVLAETV